MLKTADQLRRLTSAILGAGGSAGAEADLVADHLVQANLAGHDSHGVGMVPAYVRHLKGGLVVPNTLANAHHIGRVGAYGEMTSAAGFVSLHFVNVTDHRALVAPFRGSDGRFVTNPVCIALPGTDRQPPMLLDMATSAIAMGKIRVARNEGHLVPEGVLIDEK